MTLDDLISSIGKGVKSLDQEVRELLSTAVEDVRKQFKAEDLATELYDHARTTRTKQVHNLALWSLKRGKFFTMANDRATIHINRWLESQLSNLDPLGQEVLRKQR